MESFEVAELPFSAYENLRGQIAHPFRCLAPNYAWHVYPQRVLSIDIRSEQTSGGFPSSKILPEKKY